MVKDKFDHPQFIQEGLEYRILHGLSCEWDTALWVLPLLFQKKMKRPLFSIQDMKTRWGYWSGKNREIVLSRQLLMNHPWMAVRKVLRHEMAHQMAEEVFGALNEPPHGPSFKKACDHLRLNASVSLDGNILGETATHDMLIHEDKMLRRIQKLMSLAQSLNRHEAEAAMAKAHELIAKYNFDLVRLDQRRNFISVSLGRAMLRRFREEHQLARLLHEYYYVYCIWVSSYVIEKGKMGRVLEISGTKKNVQMASYVYDFVNRFIAARWREYNQAKGLNRYRQTDFALGVLKGFERKLAHQRGVIRSKSHEGLIEVTDALLKEYALYRYPHTKNRRGKPLRHSATVQRDGERAGRDLVISKGIANKGPNRGRLLKMNFNSERMVGN